MHNSVDAQLSRLLQRAGRSQSLVFRIFHQSNIDPRPRHHCCRPTNPPHTPGAIVMAAFADFDLTDRQRVDKRILHWSGTTRLFQIGMTIEKPCVTRTLVNPRVAADRSPARAQVSALLARWTGSCEGALLRRPRTRAGARLADSTAGFTCRPAVGARSKRLSRCSPPTCEERGATLCDCGMRLRAAA